MSSTIEPNVAGIRRAVIDHLKPPVMPVELWLLTLAVTTGTNLLDFAALRMPGGKESLLFNLAMLARVVLVFWLGYALMRRIAGVAKPFAPGWALVRFSLLAIALAIGSAVFTAVAQVAAGGEAEIADIWISRMLSIIVWTAFTIAFLAWQAALAVDDRAFTLRGLHERQRGRLTPLWLAFVAIVLPFFAVHFALTLIAVKLTLSTQALAALAFVDGAASTVQLVATCALAVVAWKLASPLREGPSAR